MAFRPATGSTYTRDAAAAAEASRFRYTDDAGTHFDYTPAYDPQREGGASAADARAGFTPGYYSVPDADMVRQAQQAAAEAGLAGPRLRVRDFPQAWHKIDDADSHAAATRAHVEATGFAYGGGHAGGGDDWEDAGAAAESGYDEDAAAKRRAAALRRAEAEWRAQQAEATAASVDSAAEAAANAASSREAQEAEDLAYAMALSASQTADDPDARLLAELELSEAKQRQRQGQGGATPGKAHASGDQPGDGDDDVATPRAGLGRSHGQALAARYWVSTCLDWDEELDAACDGFYDLWGDFTELEEAEGGRCPSLKALLGAPGMSPGSGAPREALLVDRRTDALLAERCRLLADDVAANGALQRSPEARAAYLGRYVATALGGPIGGDADAQALAQAWAEGANTLRAAARSCVLRLGDLPVGLPRHRALLFKVLAPVLHLSCRLVRGAYYCDGDDSCARVILLTSEGYEYDVDLMHSPGKLTLPPGFVPPQPEDGAAQREGARAADGLPKEEAPGAGGRAQPPQPQPSKASRSGRPGAPSRAAAAAAAASDTSAHRPRATAPPFGPRHGGATPSGPTSPDSSFEAEPGTKSDDDDTEEDVTVAELMSAYGCSAELAFEALMAADYHLPRAHLLCQGAAILGASAREVYQLLVLSGWDLEKAVQTHMDAMEEARRGGPPRAQQQRSTPAAAPPRPASGPQGWSGPPAGGAHVPARKQHAQASAPGFQAKSSSTAAPTAASAMASGSMDPAARAKATARLAELRAAAAAAAVDASSAEVVRKAFHNEWDSRVAGLDLPAVLRAFGVAVPRPEGGAGRPPSAAVRKAYREAMLRFHPDRQRDASLADRVRAEETFKLIQTAASNYSA
jgi:hypothetical protein